MPSTSRRGLTKEAGGSSRQSQLARVYATSAWRHDETRCISCCPRLECFRVVAATPIELLQRDWTAIYTWPQRRRTRTILAASNGNISCRKLDVAEQCYVRSFARRTSTATRGRGAMQQRIVIPISFASRTTASAAAPITTAFRNQFVVWIKTTIRSRARGRRKYLARLCLTVRSIVPTRHADRLAVAAGDQ